MENDKNLEAYNYVSEAIAMNNSISDPEVLLTIKEALKKTLPADTHETQDLDEVEKMCDCGACNSLKYEYCWKCGQRITGYVYSI